MKVEYGKVLRILRMVLRLLVQEKNQRFYSWDNLHNEIEVFDRLGKHLGVMDPTTGEMIKSAVKGRWLKL